ncbi:hypothetical protein INR49_012382 [Caranx melampygus]|nr:hypothetical protein INR49_012382 [Caranx melampygus]
MSLHQPCWKVGLLILPALPPGFLIANQSTHLPFINSSALWYDHFMFVLLASTASLHWSIPCLVNLLLCSFSSLLYPAAFHSGPSPQRKSLKTIQQSQ